MVAPRPNWKGYLKLSLVSLFDRALSSDVGERVRLVQSVQQNTGNRIRYKKVDAETEEVVESSDIVKGYQVDKNVYVQGEDEELEELQIESSHTIEIDKFVPAKRSIQRTGRRRRAKPLPSCRRCRRPKKSGATGFNNSHTDRQRKKFAASLIIVG